MGSPVSYERLRLKYVATINDEALPEETVPDYELQYIDIGNVDSNGGINELVPYRFSEAPSRARRRVQDGDVIISTVRTYLQAIAPIHEPPDNLIVSTGFAVVRPQPAKLMAAYCKYALRETSFLAEVIKRSVGVSYPAINASDLGNIPIFVPPSRIQEAITSYLDRETARLDALIEAKERLLELLAEKRRAIITHAVTRGLDPNAPLRDSGIPWIGKIPAHWAIRRLKYIADIYYGLSQPPEYVDSGIPFLRATNVKHGNLLIEGLVFVNEAEIKETRAIRLRAGDIIVVRSGAYTGDSAIVTDSWQGAVAGYDMLVRMRNEAAPIFISHAMLCQYILEAQIEPLRLRAAQPHLNAEELGNVVIALPPMVEQRKVVQVISKEIMNLDAVISAIEHTISLLKERRSSLIAAAVTGQISAREMVA